LGIFYFEKYLPFGFSKWNEKNPIGIFPKFAPVCYFATAPYKNISNKYFRSNHPF
jgi:hypothetical protein